jgi:hypothetical protein
MTTTPDPLALAMDILQRLELLLGTDPHFRTLFPKQNPFPYLAPELSLYDKNTEQSAIYSFGVLVFERLTDELPNRFESLEQVRPGQFPRGLSFLIDRCLACRESRISSFDDVKNTLLKCDPKRTRKTTTPNRQLEAHFLYRSAAAVLDMALALGLCLMIPEHDSVTFFMICILMEFLCVSLWQTSFGRDLLNLELRSQNQQELTPQRLALRTLLKIFSLLLLGVGYWPALYDGSKQPFYDEALAIKVLHKRS